MDINLSATHATDPGSILAAKEIEKCVHCGFCTSACPTYELDHNELDSPRGRIYLVKELLEGNQDAGVAQLHLDRCLTCRSCETACPSGVAYTTIAHAGRRLAEKSKPRTAYARIQRRLLSEFIRNRTIARLSNWALRWGGLISAQLRRTAVPSPARDLRLPPQRHNRTVSVLKGCCQEGLMPTTNIALAALLDAVGFNTRFVSAPCCGAIRHHLGHEHASLRDIQRVIKAVSSNLKQGDQAVMVAASGCASFMTEYPSILSTSPELQRSAKELATKVIDPATFLANQLDQLGPKIAGIGQGRKVVVHTPCTLAHGLNSPKDFHLLLARANFEVVQPHEPPNCCGSAGTYMLFQPNYARRLRQRMINGLASPGAVMVASANIGCIWHLRQSAAVSVHHWLDILAAGLTHKNSSVV